METFPILVIEIVPLIEAPHQLLDDLCALLGGELERVCNDLCRRRSHVPTVRCPTSGDNLDSRAAALTGGDAWLREPGAI
jgi:hypothetical protein